MDADSSLHHVFFPDSGVVSVVAVYADGSIIEMATIGREGCTGAGHYPAREAERAAGGALRGVVVPPGVDVDRFRPLADADRRAAAPRSGSIPTDRWCSA